MLVHWIWLAERPSVSDRLKAQLLQHFQDAEAIYYADGEALEIAAAMPEDAHTSLQDKDLTQAEKIVQQCVNKQIGILTYRDAAYPNRLRNIPDPPVVLYYKGRIQDLDALPLVAVVGTRHASAYGLTVAKRMGYQIASCGGVVVSGMAYGIDGMAMQGALTGGGFVIGVMGCGVDVVYPRSNQGLYADLERYGCLLSEFAPGTEPYRWNFPKRNRIISGLCCGVLVVEAPEKSGALITAHQAAEQGRDVFVVPGNIDSPSCVGSNALLRDGAIAVSSGWDVVSEYAAIYPDKIHPAGTASKQTAYPDEVAKAAQQGEQQPLLVAQKPKNIHRKDKKKKKEIDNDQSKPYIDADIKRPALSAEEETILQHIRAGQTLVDDLIAHTGMPAGPLLAALTMLEVKGLITRLPGKRVQLK